MDYFVALLLVAPAGFLYLRKSSWLVDYLIWITVLNRGIRRMVDFAQGHFNPLSPISLVPLIIPGLLLLVVIQDFPRMPAGFQRVFRFFAAALGYAFFVGLIQNQLAAIYSLAEYLAPLSLLGYAVLADGDERILDRWVKTIGWAAVAASAYGWYQYYAIPPWDAFWVRAVGFEGYLGQLESTKMVVFSTMSERGPLAGFLAFSVIPMILSKRWRNRLGWFSVVLILSVILLTFVRTALITVALAAIVHPILNRGKNTAQILLLVGVVAIVANLGVSLIPSSSRITDRLSTLQNITEDGSFVGRIAILQQGIADVLTNPLGTGLGSTGLAGRVNSGEVDFESAVGDNGYLAILYSFGWLGAGLLGYAIFLTWHQARQIERLGVRNDAISGFKTFCVVGAVVFFAGDWLAGPGSAIVFILAGFAINPGPSVALACQQILNEQATPA